MSFKSNDTNNTTINLGNYEEFFILYMDNELTPAQKQMVDTFLVAHPDLQAELELLMSTRLEPEAVSFNKEALLSDNMKLATTEEDLLLLIDNELPADEAYQLNKSIAADATLQKQYQLLLQTKLDAAEVIAYPDKNELYRHTEKVIRFGVWMRVAAAIIIIAAIGLVYNMGSTSSTGTNQPPNNIAAKPGLLKQNEQKIKVPGRNEEKPQDLLADAGKKDKSKTFDNIKTTIPQTKDAPKQDAPILAQQQDDLIASDPVQRSTSIDNPSTGISGNVNSFTVTTDAAIRNTDIQFASQTSGPKEGDAIANNKKGSVKGFLRKATRLIEKRTGIDATNENEELLIGAFAVKLK